MIVEALIALVVELITLLLWPIPFVEPPAWIANGKETLQELATVASAMGHWVPFEIVPVILPAVFLSLLAGIGIRVSRILLSFITAGGGSAG